MIDSTPLWVRLDAWLAGPPRPSVHQWDENIDDLYRAQLRLYGERVSLGGFDDRHPGEADRLMLAAGRWPWDWPRLA